jgi:hypothetical protein
MDIGLRRIFNSRPVRKSIANDIQRIDLVISGKDIHLFLPDPGSGPISMNQKKRFSFSFHNIENGMTFNLNGPWR